MSKAVIMAAVLIAKYNADNSCRQIWYYGKYMFALSYFYENNDHYGAIVKANDSITAISDKFRLLSLIHNRITIISQDDRTIIFCNLPQSNNINTNKVDNFHVYELNTDTMILSILHKNSYMKVFGEILVLTNGETHKVIYHDKCILELKYNNSTIEINDDILTYRTSNTLEKYKLNLSSEKKYKIKLIINSKIICHNAFTNFPGLILISEESNYKLLDLLSMKKYPVIGTIRGIYNKYFIATNNTLLAVYEITKLPKMYTINKVFEKYVQYLNCEIYKNLVKLNQSNETLDLDTMEVKKMKLELPYDSSNGVIKFLYSYHTLLDYGFGIEIDEGKYINIVDLKSMVRINTNVIRQSSDGTNDVFVVNNYIFIRNGIFLLKLYQVVEDVIEEINEEDMCIVCCEYKNKELVVLPCMHVKYCDSCVKKLKKCAYCQTTIIDVKKLFF